MLIAVVKKRKHNQSTRPQRHVSVFSLSHGVDELEEDPDVAREAARVAVDNNDSVKFLNLLRVNICSCVNYFQWLQKRKQKNPLNYRKHLSVSFL